MKSKTRLLAGTLVLVLSTSAHGADGTWITNASANWSATANWTGGIVADGAGSTANFTANINPARIVTLDTDRTIGNIVFTDSTTSDSNLTISGGKVLTLDAGLGNTPTINVTQSARILTISSQLSGTQGFKVTGPGILVLNASSASTLSGNVSINAGITQVLAAGAAGTGDFLMNGGTLQFVNNTNTTFGNNVKVTANSSFASAKVSGTSGDAVHSLGALTINGSTLSLTKFSSTTTGTLAFTSTTLTAGATSTFAPAAATSFNLGAVTGDATTGINQNGAGTLILRANSPSYSGTTTVTNGVVQVGNYGALGDLGTTGDLGSGAVSIASGKTLSFARSNAATFTNTISGAGGILVNGLGSYITLTNASYSGSTLVQNGMLASNNTSTNIVLGQAGSVFNYGVLALNADFTGALGIAAGNVSWAGNNASGGFAAMDAGTRIVNIGGAAATLTLGTGGFYTGTGLGGDSRIKFGDAAGTALGTVDFQNSIDLGAGTRGARFVVDGAAQVAAKLSGNIVGSGLSGGTGDAVVKFGNANMMLSGANTYTGRTVVGGQGAVILGSAGAFSANTWMNLDGGNNATLGGILGLGNGDLSANLGTSGGNVNFATSGGFAAFGADRSVTLNGGADLVWASTTSFAATGQNLILGQAKADAAVTLTNNIDLNGAVRTIYVNHGTSQIDARLSGAIIGIGGSLVKTGAGTLVLGGSSTYDGTTTVSAGSLLVNGSLGNTAVTVANTATIGGSGAVGGSLTVNGTFAPGNSIESMGTGNLAFGATATYAYELNSNVLNGDLAYSSGTLDIAAGAILTLTDLASGTLANGTTLTLISYFGAWNNGLFTYLGNTLANGDSFTIGANTWRISYDAATGGSNFTADQAGASHFVNLTVVPEPSISLLALSALGMSLLIRRRAR
jgi:fibronectin-binding autotransporter adhesin